MFPGLGGMNPKKMQGMMKQLGIKQEEVEARRVVIERDEGNIIIENPNVVKIEMQGQESWQITGNVIEEVGISEEDIKLVMEKTGKSEKEVRKILDETKDIAEAIVKLGG
ncbi:MAG: nascent polypeptide-associated complex protein [Nanoarchaeota archaeon]|nr:nascent polypeptide-associated complex protein [Nanoarchaeota archaeon]